jgi:AcrR family transcriptional regulator
MASKTTSTSDTPKLLLDAAEALIAVHGVSGTSLREITEAAGVNLALVKYHFGSKDGLVEAMLRRRMDPINVARLSLLDELEKRIPKGVLPLEEVLGALIRPVVEQCLGSGKEGARFLRVFGRLFAEPSESMVLMHKQMGPVMKRFDAALDRALPETRGADMMWRKFACMGVVQHSLLMLSMIDELPVLLRVPIKLAKGQQDPERVLRQLVSFCAAGMRAQVPDA